MRFPTRLRHRHSTSGAAAAAGGACALLEPPAAATTAAAPGPGPAVVPEPSPLAAAPTGCRVAVLGSAALAAGLATALPDSWTVEPVAEIGDITVADLVVLAAPTPGKVAAVLARQPEASVVALVHPSAQVGAVVELLGGGATACVRAGEPGLVAAHLVACARRYSVGAR